jgi:hypothetical protein
MAQWTARIDELIDCCRQKVQGVYTSVGGQVNTRRYKSGGKENSINTM